MHPVDALARRGGSATWRDLASDVARGSLVAAVTAGSVVRLGAGSYALPGAPPVQAAAVAVLGLVSCQSAAAERGWPLLRPPGRVHTTAAQGSRRRWRGTLVHRSGPAVAVAGGLTDVDTTILTSVRCLPSVVERVVLLDGLLREHVVDADDLLRLRAGLAARDPRHHSFALVDGSAQSVLESAVRVALVEAGLRVRTQVVLAGVGFVDLLVEEWLVVETDGRRVHADAFQEDRRRDVSTALLGGMTLRFTWWDVVHRLDELVAAVRTVAMAGPRGKGLTPRLGS